MAILPTSEAFERIYRSLLVADMQRELGQWFPDRTRPDERDLAYALSVATRLALSGSGEEPENAFAARRAYDVAVRALNFANGSSAAVSAVCDLILSRIGNFPARRLLRSQPGAESALKDPFLGLESLVREHENKLRGTAEEIVLTDFQVRLIRALESERSVSVSAPTSAGKSFTLEVELLRRLKDEQSYVAVFIVPTRALIRQVTFDLVRILREHGLSTVPVISAPTSPRNSPETRKLVYVLTQERLATLLTSGDAELQIDAIVVDEAHEIGESDRGLTLERVLWIAIRKFPACRLFFSSPLRSNPELLLRLFDRQGEGIHFVEHLSPVTQNLINVRRVSGKPRAAVLELVVEDGLASLGAIDLSFPFRGSPADYMGRLAVHFTKPADTAIIYCSERASADKTALAISREIEHQSDDPELSDLADFLRHEVHHHYRLASLVRKGVAFHYGNMPQIIRGRVEELLREKKLRFVCCTSTLLQGMNLPAKNIFVEDPRKGRGKGPMTKGDFWNLVGRAGRLSKEFYGNVFCIHGKDWESPVASDRLAEMESAFEVAVKERTPELLQVVREPPESAESRELSWAELAFARIYADFVSLGKRLADSSDEATNEQFSQIDSLSAGFRRTLPDEVFVNNFYVHPARLESLAARLRRERSLLQWVPISPFARNSYDRLLMIFQLFEDLMIRSGNLSYKYHTYLANQWMRGVSLRELVKDKIDYYRIDQDVDEINDAIRGLFSDLEDELRYKYVKYTRLYSDVLRAVLIERGLVAEAEALLPLHLFLEYGAANQTLINLMAIGMSRTSALLFKSALSLRDNLGTSECQGYVDRVNLARTTLPAICKAEIARLRRTMPGS
jgi:superfamily II DNA/RNA helicase